MTKGLAIKKLEKTVIEMQALLKKSKRKLLELEVAASMAEIAQGRAERFENPAQLLKNL